MYHLNKTKIIRKSSLFFLLIPSVNTEYNSNLKFLTANISNETDPKLLKLERKKKF
jgi:hypothetical protein